MHFSLTRILAFRCMVAVLLCLFAMANKAPAATIVLEDIDSGTPSPTGDYRWLDIADQLYGATYRDNYNCNDYNDTQIMVTVTFELVALTASAPTASSREEITGQLEAIRR